MFIKQLEKNIKCLFATFWYDTSCCIYSVDLFSKYYLLFSCDVYLLLGAGDVGEDRICVF